MQYSVTITKSKLTQIFVQSPSFYFTFSKYRTLIKAANSSQSAAVCVISISAFRYGSHLKTSRVIHIDVVPTKVIIIFTLWFVIFGHVVKIKSYRQTHKDTEQHGDVSSQHYIKHSFSESQSLCCLHCRSVCVSAASSVEPSDRMYRYRKAVHLKVTSTR
jgi:hypothetical protein